MRFDKYDPVSGGFRAPLFAARGKATGAVGSGATAAIGVGLDNQGRVVVGAGNTGILGVICPSHAMVAGEIVDTMTDGEIVDFGGAAGSVYYADNATGVISTGDAVGKTRIGHTVEAGRLVVRMDRGSASAATTVVGDQPAVADLNQDISAAYVEAEVQAISDKVDEILATLRTSGLVTP